MINLNTCQVVGTVSQLATLENFQKNSSIFSGCDLIEIRIDEYMDLDKTEEILAETAKKIPILLTIRTNKEGGTWEIDEQKRFTLFQRFAPYAKAFDLEILSDLMATKSRQNFAMDSTAIASFHDFEKTPDKDFLNDIISQGHSWGADVIKLACKVNKAEDIKLLKNFLQENTSHNLCIIGMGEEALETRIQFPALGSKLSYGFTDISAAPGQISAKELAKKIKDNLEK